MPTQQVGANIWCNISKPNDVNPEIKKLPEAEEIMSQSSPHLMSARAIEDIIQVQKIREKFPKFIESEILKEKIDDVDHSINKYNPCNNFTENICLPKVIEGIVVKQSEVKLRKRIEGKGSEGDHRNLDLLKIDDGKMTDETDSEIELKSWPSDSDITVLRIKKEFRNELSFRVNWEEERNLTEKSSSMNFDWESHSLINLANITTKEMGAAERLTPFTIWSKYDGQNESEAMKKKSNLTGSVSAFTNSCLAEKGKQVLYCPKDEMAFYVPVSGEENPTDELTITKPDNDLSSVLDEKINLLYRTESSTSILKGTQNEIISDFSPNRNKISQRKKPKLRGFLKFFANCSSKKSSTDKND